MREDDYRSTTAIEAALKQARKEGGELAHLASRANKNSGTLTSHQAEFVSAESFSVREWLKNTGDASAEGTIGERLTSLTVVPLTHPLKVAGPSAWTPELHFLRALGAQPDRQRAVERLLRREMSSSGSRASCATRWMS